MVTRESIFPASFPAYDGTQACASVDDPELFFPTAGNEAEAARETERICRGCVFKAPCAAWAVTHPTEEGIWGGLTERQRRRLRRRRAA